MQGTRQRTSSSADRGPAPRAGRVRRFRRRAIAILRQRCPACLAGSMFRSTFRTLPACQVCGHRFEQDPDYFRGVDLASGAIAVIVLVLLVGATLRWLRPTHGVAFALLVAALCFLVLFPVIARYPRVIRAHRGLVQGDRGQPTGRTPR